MKYLHKILGHNEIYRNMGVLEIRESKEDFERKFNFEPQEYTFNKTVKYMSKQKRKRTTVTRTFIKKGKTGNRNNK